MTLSIHAQISLESADTVKVLVPENMRDEGLIADLIGRHLRETGNRLAP